MVIAEKQDKMPSRRKPVIMILLSPLVTLRRRKRKADRTAAPCPGDFSEKRHAQSRNAEDEF